MCVDASATSPHRDTIPRDLAQRLARVREPSALLGLGRAEAGQRPRDDRDRHRRRHRHERGGEVFAVWPDTGSGNIFVVKSVDGGDHYSAPKPIAKTFGRFEIRVPSFAERKALIGTSIAAFKGTGPR